ncbi:hypothetical protein [Shewanella phage FishSpeaker]|nr:hypothetical protein [Shewanella phage FishSpeaker]
MSRTLGNLGISVGTSAALEGELTKTLSSMDNFFINFRTLVRNAIESYASEDSPSVDEIVKNVKDDLMGVLKFVDTHRGQKQILIDVYNPSYKSRESKFKYAILKSPKTDKQKARAKLFEEVISLFKKNNSGVLRETDCEIKSFVGRALILTHHVMDLTFSNSYSRLYLLESYTGYIKTYVTWNTKLTNGSELHNIPFNRLTLQIFGDKGTDFFTHSMAVKALVNELATSHKWTTGTSYDKVKSDIRGLPKSVDREALIMMF